MQYKNPRGIVNKKHNPKFNTQLYANDSFLLNAF